MGLYGMDVRRRTLLSLTIQQSLKKPKRGRREVRSRERLDGVKEKGKMNVGVTKSYLC